ncbi:MAG: 4'-phosphopantetheinyl transferase superfamily protein [Bacteroidales bacterium]|nr:4'-phosphopantetheinyl transferase superfamily protein [Bacteroidales bacterium]
MPLLPSYLTQKADVGFWRILEDEEQLLASLPPQHRYGEQLSTMTAPQRRREWLATRCLLHTWLGQEIRLVYRPDGSPMIQRPDGTLRECSITHTDDLVAIAVSNTRESVGIDIEKDAERAHRLRNRFLSPHEQWNLLRDGTTAVQLWCAKEAVYKLCRTPGLGFLEHIVLHKEERQLKATIPSLERKVDICSFTLYGTPVAVATFAGA